jgi:DNA-binding transcriptional regulator YiaG
MSYGYSQRLVDANKEADAKSLGVTLGRLCIKHGVPVSEVARYLHVSRMTVYNWFWGVTTPTASMNNSLFSYIEKLKKRK